MRKTLVVVGHGMVGHRLVELAVERGLTAEWDVVVHAAESVPAYDRVGLSSWFRGTTSAELSLVPEGFFDAPELDLRLGDPVVAVDVDARTVTSAAGTVTPYDALVLATGSTAFVPPVPGATGPGRLVYRTLDDLEQIAAAAAGKRAGAVVGGGLLGLEAADALRSLGLETTVVEFAPRLMPVQVDEAGGQALRRLVEGLGVRVRTSASTQAVEETGDRLRMVFAEGEPLEVDLVVFSAGIRPDDALARAAGLMTAERGGVLVDEACRASAPDVYAVGECASAAGRCWGLVAPGYDQAAVVVDRLLGGASSFEGADLSTKLKLMGIDVASFGDAHAETAGALELVWADPVAGDYRKLVVSDDTRTLLGGILVGDASAYPLLRPMCGTEIAGNPADLVLPAREGQPAGIGAAALPASAQVCSCRDVSKAEICSAVAQGGCRDVAGVKACTGAGTVCGSCVGLVQDLVRSELDAMGVSLSTALCEHFDLSRAEMFEVVRVKGIRTWSELLAEHGRGRGCDICKPTAASVFASVFNDHVLGGDKGSLQDTNDHMLANLQKDGTYSVVPRIPGGEVTPEHLIVIGEVARDFGLYTKITGGQRIDLFGARVEQLPLVWQRLVDAGMESGHAYGKSLRTVKSCVGSTWCRYGVQDSTTLAIELELRYRGLRSPHKVKMGVSGCARECAEARSKDVGIIATENGWNLYVGGNGGFRPRHADLFLSDVDTETLVRITDRILMLYVFTADRLQRTAPWIEGMEGGLEHLRAVVVDDTLGLCAELDAAMARHVETYRDEWAETLADPEKLARFTSFVNAPEVPDPSIAFVPERGQIRPARPDEKPLVAGPVLPIRELRSVRA
ncbi:MAG: nitrite reductase large subunit [Frankiales bacterium]|nr:MAG: nitrite reductase large subunit [Frankiales bacterium]